MELKRPVSRRDPRSQPPARAISADWTRPTRSPTGHNPLCGDRLSLTLRLDGDASATCASTARAARSRWPPPRSMTEAVKGRTRARSTALYHACTRLLTDATRPPPPRWASSSRSAACASSRRASSAPASAGTRWTRRWPAGERVPARSRRSSHAPPSERTHRRPARRRGRDRAVGQPITLQAGSPVSSRRRSGAASRSTSRATCTASPARRRTPSARKCFSRPQLPPNATEDDVRDLAWPQMRGCYDPEIPSTSSTSASSTTARSRPTRRHARGRGEDDADRARLRHGRRAGADVREKLELIPTVAQADVELVFDPPWSQAMMSEAAKLQTGMMW